MTRALLSFVICVLCVGMGLASAEVQSRNYSLAARLDEQKRKCDLIEAGNESLRFKIQMRLGEIEREAIATPLPDLESPQTLETEEWPER